MKSQLAVLMALFVLQVGCGAMDSGGLYDDDDDDDAGGDADADSDADADADADTDGPESSAGDCLDDYDNDGNGLADCSDPGCASLVECCSDLRESLLDEPFDDTLDLGVWKPFGDGRVEVREAALYPSGDDQFESGVVTNEAFALVGVIDLQITASVPDCDGPCNELLGVALTARNDYADASAVEPATGIVIDKSGEQAQLLFIVNGAVEQTAVIQGALVTLTLEIQPDRRIRVTDEQNQGVFTSNGSLDAGLTSAYVAIFGRSGSSAGVSEIKLGAGACTQPSAVHRDASALLGSGLTPFATSAVRSPAVARIPSSGALEMLFTGVSSGATAIGHATSIDGGAHWETSPGETAILTGVDMPVGYTSPDDPALLLRETDERVAVVSAASLGDASQRALVFATSPDGIEWVVLDEELLGAPEGTDCRSLRHPAIVESFTDEFTLYATCEDLDGRTWIVRGSAIGLTGFEIDPVPVLASDSLDPREIDGVAAPTVLAGSIWEMWYEARSGVRRVIRYAASSDGVNWQRWEGDVLAPAPGGAWDDLQVGEPSAVVTEAGTILQLYYTGLGPAGQAIGLVTRDLPDLRALPEL